MSNLYLVERTDYVGYDEYESMIVIADDLVSALAVTKVIDHDDRSVRLSTRSTKDVPFWTSYPRSAVLIGVASDSMPNNIAIHVSFING